MPFCIGRRAIQKSLAGCFQLHLLPDSFLSFAKGNPMRYPKKEINTPAATAEPITPEMLLAMQY